MGKTELQLRLFIVVGALLCTCPMPHAFTSETWITQTINGWLATIPWIYPAIVAAAQHTHTHTYRLTNNVLSKMPVSIAAAHRPYSI